MSPAHHDYNCTDEELAAEGRALGTILKHPEMAAPVAQYLSKQMFSVPFYRAVWCLLDADNEGDLGIGQDQYADLLSNHEDFGGFGFENCIRDLMSVADPERFAADMLMLTFRMDRLTVDMQALNRDGPRQ